VYIFEIASSSSCREVRRVCTRPFSLVLIVDLVLVGNSTQFEVKVDSVWWTTSNFESSGSQQREREKKK